MREYFLAHISEALTMLREEQKEQGRIEHERAR